LHRAADGTPYDDPNLLAKEVIRAANDVGLRIALLRVGYARSGFQTGPNSKQARFIESDSDVYLKNLEALISSVRSQTVRESRRVGIADARASDAAWIGGQVRSVLAG